MREHGYAVRPRSTKEISDAAEAFLQRCAPELLRAEGALDVTELVDHTLQAEGIVDPVDPTELPDTEAETRAGPDGRTEILMRSEFFDALSQPNASTNRARSTLAHEIGHAVLHAAELKAGRHRPEFLTLRRARREDLRPFRDSEWQAHTFAGALLMPVSALRPLAGLSHADLATRFQVSEAFVRSHLKRIRRLR